MSRQTARTRSNQDRPSLYQEITDKIVAELEAGRVPWVQPWGSRRPKPLISSQKGRRTNVATLRGASKPAAGAALLTGAEPIRLAHRGSGV